MSTKPTPENILAQAIQVKQILDEQIINVRVEGDTATLENWSLGASRADYLASVDEDRYQQDGE